MRRTYDRSSTLSRFLFPPAEPQQQDETTTLPTNHDPTTTTTTRLSSFFSASSSSRRLLIPKWKSDKNIVPQQQKNDTSSTFHLDYINRNWFDHITFRWCTPLEQQISKEMLDADDLWKITPSMLSEPAAKRLQAAWDTNPKMSLKSAILKTYRWEMFLTFLAFCVWLTFNMLTNGLLLQRVLQSLQGRASSYYYVPLGSTGMSFDLYGFFWAMGFGLSEICRSLSINQMWWSATTTALQARAAVSALIMAKTTRLRQSGTSTGETVTLVTVDSQRIMDAGMYGPFMIITPVTLIVVVIVGCFVLSVAFVVGFAILIIAYPINVRLNIKAQIVRKQTVKITSRRISLMGEILKAIKLVKLYAWEIPFAAQVHAVRKAELAGQKRALYVKAFNNALQIALPCFVVLVTFAIHTMALDLPLLPSQAFVTIALLNVARFPLSVLPQSMRCVSEARVACIRMERFLSKPEIEPNEIIVKKTLQPNEPVVKVNGGAFIWPATIPTVQGASPPIIPRSMANNGGGGGGGIIPVTSTSNTSHDGFTLDIPHLEIQPGSFVAVVGKIASGKSAFLNGVLCGEMIRIRGTSELRLASLDAPMAVVTQTPFLFNGSVLDNIIGFSTHEHVDEERLNAVLDACALRDDIDSFPGGLDTELGERGINCSGGQKARIALARALYDVDCKLLLLDDILSAVDMKTRIILFEALVSGTFRSGRTIILVTHALDLLPRVDGVVICGDGGVMSDVQVYNVELIKAFAAAATVSEAAGITHGDGGVGPSVSPATVEHVAPPSAPPPQTRRALATASEKQASIKMTEKEDRVFGSLQKATVTYFASQCGGWRRVPLTMFSLFFSEILVAVGLGLWIMAWTQNVFHEDSEFYVIGTLIVSVGTFLFCWLRGVIFAESLILGATRVHDEAFSSLLAARLQYFDVTPMGRILNRFSTDIDRLDVTLADAVETSFSLLMRSFISMIIIVVIVPWFLLALAPMLMVFIYFFNEFRPTLREMKRIDMQTRSPLLSHLESVSSRLTTIRAWGALDRQNTKSQAKFDDTTKTHFGFHATTRWSAVRLDIVTSIGSFFTAILCILLGQTISPGLAGLALTSMLQSSGVFQFATRQLMETESQLASVERLRAFATMTPREQQDGVTLPNDWPQTGHIQFENVSARYRAGLPVVLDGLTLEIAGGSSIGLTGRTGSGKSSTLLALYRIFDTTQGRILIDGIDIQTVPLHTLRTKVLSIVPQDPFFFEGGMRMNLDPFDERTDQEIFQALHQVRLQFDGGNFLTQEVKENGSNFSQGERQLLCFARALLRKTPIVLCDEATSAVDQKTSAELGTTMKELFHGRTLLSIAHRLDFVSSLDRVAVLDQGKVVEFGDPRELLRSGKGWFWELWNAEMKGGGGGGGTGE